MGFLRFVVQNKLRLKKEWIGDWQTCKRYMFQLQPEF